MATIYEMNQEIKEFCEHQFCCRTCILNIKENKGICYLDNDDGAADFMNVAEMEQVNATIEENYKLIKAKEGITTWKTHK